MRPQVLVAMPLRLLRALVGALRQVLPLPHQQVPTDLAIVQHLVARRQVESPQGFNRLRQVGLDPDQHQARLSWTHLLQAFILSGQDYSRAKMGLQVVLHLPAQLPGGLQPVLRPVQLVRLLGRPKADPQHLYTTADGETSASPT